MSQVEFEVEAETEEVTETEEVASIVDADGSEGQPEGDDLMEMDTEGPASPERYGFRALGLSDALVAAVEKSGYTTPTPIQSQTIPLLLEGRDVLGQAQTGTGKTAAFALPLLDRIDLSQRKPQVLVLTPTRELAIQLTDAFARYARNMGGFRTAAIYGGQDIQLQFGQLERGVHVVVGTPGRVMDHMRRGSLKLDDLQCLVLDEGDEMLRMGFVDDVQWVLTQAPPTIQMALFSATMPEPIRQIAQQHLKDPAHVTIAQKTATADTVNQRYVIAAPHQKQAALARILEAEPTEGVLVFVKMRSTTEPVAEYLAERGLKTAALNGDIAQKQRVRIVESLRSGKLDVIVATDVAARGLDVQRISHVINYDLPFDSEAYIHRIGRTGRAGRSGEAILFVHPRERRMLTRLEQATRQKIEPMELPSNRAINKQRVIKFHERITEALACKDIEIYQSIVEQYQRDSDVPLEKIAAALAVLAKGDGPLLVNDEVQQMTFATDTRRDSREKSYGSDRKFDRKGKSDRSDSPRSSSPRATGPMNTYRIEVGRNHQVQPGNIVGAIANESGISHGSIGKIKIFDLFSTVDLPEGIPSGTIDGLKNVYVAGRKMEISRMGSAPYEGKKPNRPFDKSKFKSKFKPKDKFRKKAK